ncbi:DNA/RNA non-specific endonuclease [Chitinophaga qingshengii]|uniref:DNA/RNA non-specific endonuclease n=1 Tax=Chitinophaga qingshengii TaxID=1569794 RepID=A0ABR7TGF8_9BACT|nr:DNA/RNA non-specific endonuclease [Chitinophaga qingshengii]MBC9929543.1 DNA/RNA non-specific endonuclease [Chitinophaga qingshengii]
MPKKKPNRKSKQNNSLAVAVILILITFAVTTCSRKIAGRKEKEPPRKTAAKSHRKKQRNKYLLQENFEKGSKTNYNAETVSLSSGNWIFKDAVTGGLDEDHKAGKQALRIRDNGMATMDFDIAVSGTVTVTLQYALYGKDKQGTWELWASVNQGQRFTKVGDAVSVSSNRLQPITFTASTQKTIRFRIKKTDKDSRLNFDGFRVSTGGKEAPVVKPEKGAGAVPGDDNNLLLGNPSNATTALVVPNNYLMDKGFYILSYNRDNGTPNWVSWHITADDLGSMARGNDFRPDADVPEDWFQVTQFSYNGSGFDRGHNCPSGDRTASREANEATFLMTNMIPQAPNHNQHLWSNLESYTRSLVKAGNEVYVIMGSYGTGGTGSKGMSKKIGGNRVNVPARIWKVIVVLPEGNNDLKRISRQTRIIAVNTPNDNQVNTKWSAYLTSIADIEKATGYRLLSNVPAAVREELVRKIDTGE